MPDPKINFCSKFAVKLFRASVANGDTGSQKSLRTLFDTNLDHMPAKFEPNCKVRKLQNFELSWKKNVDPCKSVKVLRMVRQWTSHLVMKMLFYIFFLQMTNCEWVYLPFSLCYIGSKNLHDILTHNDLM